MKRILLIVVLSLVSGLALAKKGGPVTEALYIVPGPADMVPSSRFLIEIVKPFKNYGTKEISYIFPEALIGEPDRLIELKKIPNTDNSWSSEELTAHCTLTGDMFSCNIYVNKNVESADLTLPWYLQWFLPQAIAAQPSLLCGGGGGLSPVQGHFCSNEPAGLLIYEID